MNNTLIKENLLRIAATATLGAAMYFSFQSNLKNETSTQDKNYNIASAIIPVGAMFNMGGRIYDHWHQANKKTNIAAGFAAILTTLLATGFSVAGAIKDFKQPISLPVLFQSIIILFISGLNWEPIPATEDNKTCKKIMAKNAGRILAFNGIGATAALSISSILKDSKQLFFAANTGLGVTAICESGNRVYDIVVTNQKETNALNKACAVLFFLLMMAETVTSALTTAEVWKNQPIAFPTLIKNVGMILYMIAQSKFKPTPSNAQSALDDQGELSTALTVDTP